jgi:hypothetical protein
MKLDLIPRPLVIITTTLFEIDPEPNLLAGKTPALVDVEIMYEIENQMDEIKKSTLPRRDSIFILERKINSKILLKKTRIEITTKYLSLPNQAKHPVGSQPCWSTFDEY